MGQLKIAEFDERSAACAAATTRGELVDLLADLVEDPDRILVGTSEVAPRAAQEPSHVSDEAATPVQRSLAQVDPSVHGARSLSVGLFGGTTVRGTPIASHHTTLGVFGGTDVDLRGAALKENVTTIQAVAAFGGADVWVPEGFRVRVNGFGLFGGHDIHIEGGAIDPADLPTSAPEIVVNCFSLFGGVDVHVTKR